MPVIIAAVIVIAAAVILWCLLLHENENAYETLTLGDYVLENGANDYCGLSFYNENQFSFFTSLYSSYIQAGTFEEKNGIIVCTTSDGTREYRFEIKDDKTLVFLKDKSAAPDSYGEEYEICDGETFILKK